MNIHTYEQLAQESFQLFFETNKVTNPLSWEQEIKYPSKITFFCLWKIE